jgi:NAD(P)-dependent dehydrogenase (short-subunit alcohol dehydrogenase family)
MNKEIGDKLFNITGKVAVITGGGGILCSTVARGLAEAGAQVAVLDLNLDGAKRVADEITAAGGRAVAFECNVLERDSIEVAARQVMETFKRVDILINGAGGNKPQASTNANQTFFDIPPEAVQWVFNLNFIGTLLPSQVFGKKMADHGEGVILNISSMNAFRPLTRIPAYSAAKAAVSNFTQWLAVNLAQEFTPKIRVNAIAPGFFLTDQNRFLLTEKETGELTARGQSILAHTPQNRFGVPEDLIGTILWLVSPASEFVTGIVVPIDGGFSAFSGV